MLLTKSKRNTPLITTNQQEKNPAIFETMYWLETEHDALSRLEGLFFMIKFLRCLEPATEIGLWMPRHMYIW